MTNQTPSNYYDQYDLAPSQCCEWIARETSEMQSHVVMAFGWMSTRPENVSPYHLEQVGNQVARLRQLADILQAHVDRVSVQALEVEAA